MLVIFRWLPCSVISCRLRIQLRWLQAIVHVESLTSALFLLAVNSDYHTSLPLVQPHTHLCSAGIEMALTAASWLLQTSDKAVLEVLADANLPDNARIEQIVELLVSPGTVRTSAH